MMKSPSAKELGAKSGLTSPSKGVAQSQRTGVKVSSRIGVGMRMTARPTVTKNKSPGVQSSTSNQLKRTKFTPSTAAIPGSGTVGKPPIL